MSGRFTQFARYSQYNNEAVEAVLNMFRQNVLNFLQQSRKILPNQLLKSINQLLIKQSSDRSLQQCDQNIIMIQKLLAVNKICLNYMSKKITDLQHNQKIITSKSTKENQFINYLQCRSQQEQQQNIHKNYKILQQSIQKAQNEIRKHIGLEQQMKICFDQQQQEIYDLKKHNRSLKQQNSQLKKQILLLKGKQKQIQKKVKGLQQRQNQNYKNQFKTNLTRLGSKKKKIDKINTQPQCNAIFSDYQYKKLTNEQYQISKQISINKSGQHSKLVSKKSCNLMQNQINVNLNSSIKLKTHENQNKIKNNESKQIFWNRRLKKKPNTTYINYSTNISPRLLNKQKKNSSKDRYQTLTNHTKMLNKSKQYANQLMQSQKRKAYSNSNSMEMKQTFGDRSTSVIY